MSPSCASFVSYYFQFYPYWPLVNPPRRGPSRPSKLSGKPKSLLTLLLGYDGLELLNLLYFYPPSHPNFYRQSTNPLTNHVPRALSYSSTKRTLGMTLPEAFRGSAIHRFLVKVSIHISPAEEGHRIGFIINTTVVPCRWHHHYFNSSSSSSPSNITTVVMSTIIPVLLVTEPHQTIASFL